MPAIDVPYRKTPSHPINRVAQSDPVTVHNAQVLTSASPLVLSSPIDVIRYNQVVLHFDSDIVTAGHEIKIAIQWSREVIGDPDVANYSYESAEESIGSGKFQLRKYLTFLLDGDEDEDDRTLLIPVQSRWVRVEVELRNTGNTVPAGGSTATISVFAVGRNN